MKTGLSGCDISELLRPPRAEETFPVPAVLPTLRYNLAMARDHLKLFYGI